MSGRDDEWEYETLRPPRGATKKEAIDPKAQLNELGGDGWELVTTVEYVGGGTKYMVFKRPTDTNNDDSRRDGAGTGTDDGATANDGTSNDGSDANTDTGSRDADTAEENG